MRSPRIERGRLGLSFSRGKLVVALPVRRIPLLPRLIACVLILTQIGFVADARARPQDPEKPLHDWANASDLWLRAKVIPNAMLPAPEPTRRGLLLSYEFSPEK